MVFCPSVYCQFECFCHLKVSSCWPANNVQICIFCNTFYQVPPFDNKWGFPCIWMSYTIGHPLWRDRKILCNIDNSHFCWVSFYSQNRPCSFASLANTVLIISVAEATLLFDREETRSGPRKTKVVVLLLLTTFPQVGHFSYL